MGGLKREDAVLWPRMKPILRRCDPDAVELLLNDEWLVVVCLLSSLLDFPTTNNLAEP